MTIASPINVVNDPLDFALEYAARGWQVFPCWADGENAKKPIGSVVPNGFWDATTDQAVIRRWWRRFPKAIIGAPVPPAFSVVDVDIAKGGLETLAKLADEHGQLPDTLRAHTGGGGLHFYFRHPGLEVRQGQNILGQGIDTRQPGRGYVILPPSRTTGVYKWHNPKTPAAEMPGWLVAKLRPDPPARKPLAIITGDLDGYAAAALRGEVVNVSTASVGVRHDTLRAAARKLGGLIGLIDLATIKPALLSAALSAGLSEKEAEAAIEWGWKNGQERPRQVVKR